MKYVKYLCSVCFKKIEPSKDAMNVCPECFSIYHMGCKYGHKCIEIKEKKQKNELYTGA